MSDTTLHFQLEFPTLNLWKRWWRRRSTRTMHTSPMPRTSGKLQHALRTVSNHVRLSAVKAKSLILLWYIQCWCKCNFNLGKQEAAAISWNQMCIQKFEVKKELVVEFEMLLLQAQARWWSHSSHEGFNTWAQEKTGLPNDDGQVSKQFPVNGMHLINFSILGILIEKKLCLICLRHS